MDHREVFFSEVMHLLGTLGIVTDCRKLKNLEPAFVTVLSKRLLSSRSVLSTAMREIMGSGIMCPLHRSLQPKSAAFQGDGPE
jgi:hypothetical protein